MQPTVSNNMTTDTAENPWCAVQISTTVGDDTDTIDAIIEAVPGLAVFQLGNVARVVDTNRLNLEGTVRGLLARRTD